jgi:hypothetical protein
MNVQRVSGTLFRFQFSYRLSDEVTARWLSEECPVKRLMADEADRQTRFLSGGLFRSAVHEKANEGRDFGSPPKR